MQTSTHRTSIISRSNDGGYSRIDHAGNRLIKGIGLPIGPECDIGDRLECTDVQGIVSQLLLQNPLHTTKEEVEEAQQQTNSGYEVAYDATDASYSTLARPSEGEDSHNYSAEESHHADVEEDEEEEFNPYLFIKSLPRYNLVVPYPHHKICLPPKDPSDPPISLVLDLDETLVHCTVEPISDADMVFPVVFNGVEYSVNVRKRPYLEEFLQKVAGKFEVSATR